MIFKNYIKIIRYKHFLKNTLIFLPILFENNLIEPTNLINLLIGFIGFSFLTNSVYILNDYSDFEIDKKNKLKKNSKINKKNYIIYFLISILIFIIFYLNFNSLLNKFILIYLLNFFLYNYLFKKIKFLDIILLSNFYLIRIMYGFEIYNKFEISTFFLIFVFFFFITIAICKRLVQIKINNLKIKNNIIPYSKKDNNLLKKFANFSLGVNILIFFVFIVNLFFKFDFLKELIIYRNNFDLVTVFLVIFSYSYICINLFSAINITVPKKDIFLWFISNKIIVGLLFFTFACKFFIYI